MTAPSSIATRFMARRLRGAPGFGSDAHPLTMRTECGRAQGAAASTGGGCFRPQGRSSGGFAVNWPRQLGRAALRGLDLPLGSLENRAVRAALRRSSCPGIPQQRPLTPGGDEVPYARRNPGHSPTNNQWLCRPAGRIPVQGSAPHWTACA